MTRPTWLHARATAPPHHAARRCTLPPLGPRSSATVRLHPPHVPAGEPSSSRTAPCHGWPPTVACSIVRADVRRARRLGVRRAGDAVSNRRGASYRRPTALRISLHSLHTCRSGLREWGSCRVASAPHHRNSPLAFQTRVLGVRPLLATLTVHLVVLRGAQRVSADTISPPLCALPHAGPWGSSVRWHHFTIRLPRQSPTNPVREHQGCFLGCSPNAVGRPARQRAQSTHVYIHPPPLSWVHECG